MKNRLIILVLLIFNTTFSFAQDDLVAPVATPEPDSGSEENVVVSETQTEKVQESMPLNEENVDSETIALDKEQIKKLIEQSSEPEPYQVSCAPQVLSTSIKNNYNAYTIGVSPSKLQKPISTVESSQTTVLALNATVSEVYRKSLIGSVAGNSFSSVINSIPAFLSIALGQSPKMFAPSVLSLAGTTVPAVTTGISEYSDGRAARREAFYYDGIFRSLEEHLNRSSAYIDRRDLKKKNGPLSGRNKVVYRQLPLYSNIIVNKQSNNGKPIIQVINSAGQSWSYALNCDAQLEVSTERQQAIDMVQKLKEVIDLH